MSKEEIEENTILQISEVLPQKIAIVYSIQYECIARKIKDILARNHKIFTFLQVLGCTKTKLPKEVQAVLLIGSGIFHSFALALNPNIPIYIYDSGKLVKLSQKEIEAFLNRKKGAYIKYLSSKKVGVLISTKPGQQNLDKALSLKKKIKGKEIYFFIGDFISTSEFENFGLDCWINTACPRLDIDSSSIINVSDIS
jgi:diphthamide biosynthesis enzyme Dph1/Dph2-like protein